MIRAEVTDPRSSPSPRVIDHRYRIEAELGRGGSGVVYAAHDLLLDRPVALKQLHVADDADAIEPLRSEFRVLRGMRHPGIVRVFDLGVPRDAPAYFTMERLQGGDLTRHAGRVDPDVLVEKLGRALDAVHAQGLVHSDLKPSNVFLPEPARLVITDFGLARRTQGGARERPFGTLAYLPPERLRGGREVADPREDLYALGAILFEVLTGKPPYVGPDAESTLEALRRADLAPELERVPSAWRSLLAVLLDPDPEGRPRSAWEVLHLWSTLRERPPPQPEVLETPFVGRRRERALVRRAAAQCARGRGAALHVDGDAGMGKSVFLQTAATALATQGVATLFPDTPTTPEPLWLIQWLARAYGRWAPALPAEAAAAARRLAAWPAAVQTAGDEDAATHRHVDAIADMGRVAAVSPHALILDDAHRLDSGSAHFLALLAYAAPRSGILVLSAARPAAPAAAADGGAAPYLQAVESGAIQRLRLRPFQEDEVAALIERRFGPNPDFAVLATRIHQLTQGHPFFVSEALQHLILTEQLYRDRQAWRLAPRALGRLLPRVADTILSEHLAAIPETDATLYETLARLPGGAPAELLARLTGLDVSTVRERLLAHGVRSGLLQRDDAGRFRFQHELIREACAARCPRDAARRLHLRIAATLAGTPDEAYHRLQARERSAEARACFLRVAREFDARRAYPEALRYYEAALDLWSEPGGVMRPAPTPGSGSGVEAEVAAHDLVLTVARLRLQLGRLDQAAELLLQSLAVSQDPNAQCRALHLLGEVTGRLGRYDEASYHLHAAAEKARALGDTEQLLVIQTDLASLQLARGDVDAAIALCHRARADMESASPATRARLLLAQAQAERQRGDYAAAETTCRAALDILKPEGRTLELAQTYTQIGTNYYYRGDYEEAIRFHAAAVKVHRELGNLHGLNRAQSNLGNAQMRAGHLEEATRSIEQSLELKRRLGDRIGEGSGLNNLGNLWDKRGDARRALSCYRRGIRILEPLHRPRELATLYHNAGEIHLRLGRFVSARRHLERAAEWCRDLTGSFIQHMVAYNRGLALTFLFEPAEATGILRRGLDAVESRDLDSLRAPFHAALAFACARAGDRRASQSHIEAAREGLDDLAADTRLDTLLVLCEAHAARGDWEALERLAAQAAASAADPPRPLAQVRALRLQALAQHRRGDWDLAEATYERARAEAEALHFRYELAQCYKGLGLLHREIGLHRRAEAEFERCFRLLEALRLRTELGLAYLEGARGHASGA